MRAASEWAEASASVSTSPYMGLMLPWALRSLLLLESVYVLLSV
jgi:hypothetical protein